VSSTHLGCGQRRHLARKFGRCFRRLALERAHQTAGTRLHVHRTVMQTCVEPQPALVALEPRQLTRAVSAASVTQMRCRVESVGSVTQMLCCKKILKCYETAASQAGRNALPGSSLHASSKLQQRFVHRGVGGSPVIIEPKCGNKNGRSHLSLSRCSSAR